MIGARLVMVAHTMTRGFRGDDDDNDDVPVWVRFGLTDLRTRRRARWFRDVSAALGIVMVGAGFIEPQAALISTAFFATTAWVYTSMIWMDANNAW